MLGTRFGPPSHGAAGSACRRLRFASPRPIPNSHLGFRPDSPRQRLGSRGSGRFHALGLREKLWEREPGPGEHPTPVQDEGPQHDRTPRKRR